MQGILSPASRVTTHEQVVSERAALSMSDSGQPSESGSPVDILQLLRINADEGFFHVMLSYRVNPDSDFVTKVHDKTHLLNAGSFGQQSTETHTPDYFPWPRAFSHDDTVRGSSLRLFQDSYCLKDGYQWEGDGGTHGGGFLGALRLSVVFAPIFSAEKKDGKFVGSLGQMIELAQEDKQDNVLLELIIARELHLLSKMAPNSDKKALFPCSCILPLFRSQSVWAVGELLPDRPSAITNKKALDVMKLIGIPLSGMSEELRDGSLTVAKVWSFFGKFQGVKLYDHGSEKYQIVAAARSIIRVIKDAVSALMIDVIDMNCAQLYELFGFLSEQNIPYYTSILASHNITSVSQLAVLNQSGSTKIIQLIAEKGNRHAHASSTASELVKLRSAVAAAKVSPLSKSLNSRFRDFIDADASLVTALQSSSLFEILLSKKIVLLFISVACMIIALSLIWQIVFPSDSTVRNNNQYVTIIQHSLFIVIYSVQILASIVAYARSPRQGKYLLSFACFLWFCVNSLIYGVSVYSAIHDECRQCDQSNPAVLSQNSVVLNVLNQTCWPPIFAATCILMLFNQRLLVPVVFITFNLVILVPIFVSIFSVSTASNTIFSLSQGGGYNFPLLMFWLSLYVMFRLFLRIGNQHAKKIYKENAADLDKVNSELDKNLRDQMVSLRSLTYRQSTSEAPTMTSYFRRMFGRTHPQQDSQSTCERGEMSCSARKRGIMVPLLQSLASESKHFDSDHFGGAVDTSSIMKALEKLSKTSRSPIVQPHSSFASLIKDAEFINYAFQEWVSVLLSSGVDANVEKICNLSNDNDTTSHQQVKSHEIIKGKHVRGPVKHIDRAIAKVTFRLCTFCFVCSFLTLPKAYRSYEGNFKRLTDVVRCSLVLDTPEDMIRVLKASSSNLLVILCKWYVTALTLFFRISSTKPKSLCPKIVGHFTGPNC
jgi:hypothetical protein